MPKAVILLVDDERTILDSLKAQLRHMFARRFAYETAESAPEAWDVIEDLAEQKVPVVVIVSDWLMPEVRGDVFLAEVRQRFPQIARIMLTGQADEDAIRRAYDEAQVLGVMHKPWSIEELQELIERGVASLG